MLERPFALCVDEPVISATKKAKEMEIVMMSRTLGLRLNAMLMRSSLGNRWMLLGETLRVMKATGFGRFCS